MNGSLIVSAPSRLHFGLFSVGANSAYQFGGAGVMIARPRTVVSVVPDRQLELVGAESATCLKALTNWFRLQMSSSAPIGNLESVQQLPLRIQVQQSPPRHAGFGSGTQLAMATVIAAMTAMGHPMPGVEELASMTGRGKRSAIGSHGFFRGGFLVDRGKSNESGLSSLEFQHPFPDHWPIVTILGQSTSGITGPSEQRAFGQLPPSSSDHRSQMTELVKTEMIPALIETDYPRFGNALFEFGRRSGEMFSSIQSGAFNGVAIEATVRMIRDFGIPAVAQSSWGPCVFAVASDTNQANSLIQSLLKRLPAETVIQLTHADNQGAQLVSASPGDRDPVASRFGVTPDGATRPGPP